MTKLFKWTIIIALLATLLTEAKEYKGAEYRTKETFLYGRFEVRMIPAHRSGVVSSFFTYHEINDISEWNEIDIEILGRYDDQMQVNTITPNITHHVSNRPTGFNPYEDFHDYAFEWTPFYVAWFIDGEEVYRQSSSHVGTLNKAQKIMMNLWIADWENWVGPWDNSSLPAFSYYDRVKYYSYAPGSGDYGTDNNFLLEWTDEFDNFDSNRWEKATHTFNGNLVDFSPDNIVFRDGKMILCLTDSENQGYQDFSSPVVLWAKNFGDGTMEIKFSEELEKTSAETISNFNLTDGSVISASLSGDKTSVFLTTENHDPSSSSNIVVLNVKDEFGNSISPSAVTIIPALYLTLPAKINVGGTEIYGYLPDDDWDETKTYGHISGYDKNWAGIDIIGTTEDNIYLNDREAPTKYIIKVPNGKYQITFKFAEKFWGESGQRIFDVFVENSLKIEDLDLYATAGKNTAIDVAVNVEVVDEQVDIILSPDVDIATLSGIIITELPNSVGDVPTSDKYVLYQNFPNPFNSNTNFQFFIPEANRVSLKIFDVLGNEITTLVESGQNAGAHRIFFSAERYHLSSGIYFYTLTAGNFIQTKKMIYLK